MHRIILHFFNPALVTSQGQSDCVDHSDEESEQCSESCTESDFTCKNGKCITKTWLCDQEDDCGDGSDESEEHCSKLSWVLIVAACKGHPLTMTSLIVLSNRTRDL